MVALSIPQRWACGPGFGKGAATLHRLLRQPWQTLPRLIPVSRSTVFWMAVLCAYLADVRSPGAWRRGLLWLLFIYAGVNFVMAFTNVLMIPLILSFASEASAGGVMSAAGVGMLIGSVAVSASRWPKCSVALSMSW